MDDSNNNTLNKIQDSLNWLKSIEIEIASVFDKYGYLPDEYQIVLKQLSFLTFYKSKSQKNILSYPVEALLKETLDIYIFITDNDSSNGITLRSNKYSNQSIVIKNIPTMMMLKRAIAIEINKYIDELDEVRGFKSLLKNEYPDKENITPSDILAFLNKNNINSSHYKIDDTYKMMMIYNILLCTKLICRERNQKNTTAIKNKECALIYDIYVIVEELKKDLTKKVKDKTNFVKPRIMKNLNKNIIE